LCKLGLSAYLNKRGAPGPTTHILITLQFTMQIQGFFICIWIWGVFDDSD